MTLPPSLSLSMLCIYVYVCMFVPYSLTKKGPVLTIRQASTGWYKTSLSVGGG